MATARAARRPAWLAIPRLNAPLCKSTLFSANMPLITILAIKRSYRHSSTERIFSVRRSRRTTLDARRGPRRVHTMPATTRLPTCEGTYREGDTTQTASGAEQHVTWNSCGGDLVPRLLMFPSGTAMADGEGRSMTRPQPRSPLPFPPPHQATAMVACRAGQ